MMRVAGRNAAVTQQFKQAASKSSINSADLQADCDVGCKDADVNEISQEVRYTISSINRDA
jgi:hypothetical protein